MISRMVVVFPDPWRPTITIEVKPSATKIHVDVIGVGWIPYRSDAQGRLQRA